jgi:hypothetical protein
MHGHRRLPLAVLTVALASLVVLAGCGASPAAPADQPALASPQPVATHPPALGGSRAALALSTADAPLTPTTTTTKTTTATPTPTSKATHLSDPLRLQFKRGEQRRYTQTMKLTMDLPMLSLGQRLPAVTMTMNIRYEVLDVAHDGSARVRSTLDRMTTSEPSANSATATVEGTSVTARVATDGTFSEAQVERKGQVVATGAEAERVASSLMLFPYLNGPLLIGDSFHGRQSISLAQDMPATVMDIRYTLADVAMRDGVEVARLDETADMPQLTLSSPAPGMDYRNGKGSLKGSILVSTADGWPVAGDATTTMSFELRGPDPRMSGTVTARGENHLQLEYEVKGQSL